MSTLKTIYGLAIAIAVGASAASCTDYEEWDVDSSHDRLFGVSNDDLTVSPGDTYAEVTFTKVTDAEYYIIEVSTDSLTNDIGLGESAGSIVYGEDGSITSSPDTLTGLIGDTRYYLRIKSMSSQEAESKWVYYDNGSPFTTEAEQLFNTPTDEDRGDTWIHLSWTVSNELTHLAYVQGMDTVKIDMTDEMLSSGEYTVEGLKGSTTYTFILYYNESKRGTITVSTMAAPPSDAYLYTLDDGVTRIDQTLIDEIAAIAQAQSGADPTNYSVTIGINPGTTVSVYATDPETGDDAEVSIPDGMSVTFFGLAGGSTPTLDITQSLDISGSHNYIRFENVSIVDGGAQYFINEGDETTIGSDLSFTDCKFSDFARSLIRLKDEAAITIDSIKIDNCIATDMSTGAGYAMMYWNNSAYTVGTVRISNSTFDTFSHSFMDIRKSNTGSVEISGCTFYNGPGSDKYIIDTQDCTGTSFTLSGCIFSACQDASKCRGIRNDADPEISEVYFTNDFALSSAAFTPTVQLEYSASELFADPENGDFTLLNDDIGAGDPRWK